MHPHSNYREVVPDYIKESLDRYVKEHCPVGGFLYAVLTNNLSESFAHADDDNAKILHHIVIYIYNELPSICWGSEEKVKVWLAKWEAKMELKQEGDRTS